MLGRSNGRSPAPQPTDPDEFFGRRQAAISSKWDLRTSAGHLRRDGASPKLPGGGGRGLFGRRRGREQDQEARLLAARQAEPAAPGRVGYRDVARELGLRSRRRVALEQAEVPRRAFRPSSRCERVPRTDQLLGHIPRSYQGRQARVGSDQSGPRELPGPSTQSARRLPASANEAVPGLVEVRRSPPETCLRGRCRATAKSTDNGRGPPPMKMQMPTLVAAVARHVEAVTPACDAAPVV
jgi:hypothetical protein